MVALLSVVENWKSLSSFLRNTFTVVVLFSVVSFDDVVSSSMIIFSSSGSVVFELVAIDDVLSEGFSFGSSFFCSDGLVMVMSPFVIVSFAVVGVSCFADF